MIANSIVEEIKSRLDIVDFISDYADLKKAGSNFKALCPFHSEKTPSFMVSPQKQIFHCFGCGAGGDIFGFIMRYENVSFPEALQTLAEKAGVELKRTYSRKAGKENEFLYQIHEDATQFFSSQLESNSGALDYLRERGLDEETVKTFRLGYIPPKFDALLKHLKGKGYSESMIEKAGLIKSPEGKKPYDMFRGRIIFPICDVSGKVVAFGARILNAKADTNVPKYINSPETAIFKKSYTLYGFNIAHKAIREKDYALVAEGYMDVIVCHQYGFKNAVAPLGTAITEGHLKRIRSCSKKLLLVFDADEAGLKAARRSLSIIYENGMRAKVLLLPEGNDPDSFLNKKGAEEYQKLFPQSKDLVQFYLDLKEDRTEIIKELIGIASRVQDRVVQGELIKEISRETSILDMNIKEEIQNIQKGKKVSMKHQNQTKTTLPEELLLSIAYAYPEYAKDIIKRINIEDIEKNILKNIFLTIKGIGDVQTLENMSSVFDADEVEYITSLTIESGFDEDKIMNIVEDCFRKIKIKNIKSNVNDIELRIKVAESSGDLSLLNSLLSQKQSILQEAKSEGLL